MYIAQSVLHFCVLHTFSCFVYALLLAYFSPDTTFWKPFSIRPVTSVSFFITAAQNSIVWIHHDLLSHPLLRDTEVAFNPPLLKIALQ